MTLPNIPTYYLLDTWSEIPPSMGWRFAVARLRLRGCETNEREVKQAVYERLVNIGLLAPNTKPTPKDWKRAKRRWKSGYSGSLMQ
jgi:hypothetical protein